ncbi:MAG TPA: RNA pseudouridine synthase [Cryomorphaceae bacterium]|nr:RNA pseudouridine synthase [Owenweeksia sp.]MBF99519.1 RNA pseudouridine synthase [Owenweeksia sp.]HAD98663.1 RNA pseudouridine synthase [Cryomorphaceae bacterium]HBF18721.1 RNA pseudouridine synthase [Cryomorphaceae bacterium]
MSVALEKKRILFEDNHLLAALKLPGELVQGDHTGDTPLLEKVREYIRITYDKPGNVYTGLIHRLDRPTSGVVLFAKTSKALARMNAVFEKREVAKTYWALIKGKPDKEEDRLVNYLKKDEKKNKSFAVSKSDKLAKKAILNYRCVDHSESYSLLEVELETGRHHQIRVQLATAGMSIKGDLKYGFPRSNHDASISLHARSISFEHPVSGEHLKITAPVPEGDKVWRYFSKLDAHK